jgi:hypothetical protein
LENTRRAILDKLVDVQCQGVYVNTLRPCVQNGTICSEQGSCVSGQCLCNATRTGDYCESVVSDSSDLSVGAIVGITVGVVVPFIFLLALLLLAALFVSVFFRNRRVTRNSHSSHSFLPYILLFLSTYQNDEEWMIDVSEIEFAELLGVGGFGEVRKAVWRGTEVAVKTVASCNVTHDMRNAFIDEVRVMTSLRHPNVVLFMGAATKPPKMCIGTTPQPMPPP